MVTSWGLLLCNGGAHLAEPRGLHEAPPAAVAAQAAYARGLLGQRAISTAAGAALPGKGRRAAGRLA